MRARGQAATELALALTVMVTLLLFSFYLAELAYVRLKTQEAATSTAWDLTAVRIDKRPSQLGVTQGRLTMAVQAARARYLDLDGRSGPRTLRTTGTMFITPPRLDLEATAGVRLGLEPIPLLANAYADVGGVRVRAWADLETSGLTRSFLEGTGGLFSAPHLSRGDFRVRSAGAPNAASSVGLTLALGDWGLQGVRERGECKMQGDCGSNPTFGGLVREAHRASGDAAGVIPGQATRLAMAVWGTPLADEDKTWISAPGEESGFQERGKNGPAAVHPHADNQFSTWTTTPGARWPLAPASVANRYADLYACRQPLFPELSHPSCP